jgi:hypothetical protein
VADEAVELDEGTGVEKLLEPLVGEQLPLLALSLDGLLARRIERLLAEAVEQLELVLGRVGAIVGRRHAAEPN